MQRYFINEDLTSKQQRIVPDDVSQLVKTRQSLATYSRNSGIICGLAFLPVISVSLAEIFIIAFFSVINDDPSVSFVTLDNNLTV